MRTLLSLPRLHLTLWILLIVVAAFLRLYRLESLPPALYQDETAIGYNAYLINETGKDEYGSLYPLYFKSFGDYKLPAYIYATAASINVFGLNAFAVRLPSALAGIISIATLGYLVWLLTKNQKVAYAAALLLAINPLHLLFSRAGFEVNLATMFMLLGVTAVVMAIQFKRILFLALSILWFALALYSYNVTRLLAPLTVIGTTYLMRAKLVQFPKKQLAAIAIFGIVLISPFLITFFSPSGAASAQDSLITSNEIIAHNVEMRSYLHSVPQLYVKLFFNNYVFLVIRYLENLVTIISGQFYFVSGSEHGNQGLGNVGTMYLFQVPLFIVGLIQYIRKKEKHLHIFGLWLITSILTLALSKEVPHATRGFFIIVPAIVFSATGLVYMINLLKKQPTVIAKFATVAFSILVFYNLQFFFFSFVYRFPAEHAKAWRTADRDLALYLKENAGKYDKIIIDKEATVFYTSLLFYLEFPAEEYLKTSKYEQNGLTRAIEFGNYEIKDILWSEEMSKHDRLIVTTKKHLYEDKKIVQIIRNPKVYVALALNNVLNQYPVDEIEFLLIETPALKNKVN